MEQNDILGRSTVPVEELIEGMNLKGLTLQQVEERILRFVHQLAGQLEQEVVGGLEEPTQENRVVVDDHVAVYAGKRNPGYRNRFGGTTVILDTAATAAMDQRDGLPWMRSRGGDAHETTAMDSAGLGPCQFGQADRALQIQRLAHGRRQISQQGLPMGSGLVEGTCKFLAGKRSTSGRQEPIWQQYRNRRRFDRRFDRRFAHPRDPRHGILATGMKKAPAQGKALVERMKELNCLYEISSLFSHHSLGLERLLREIVKVIPRAWQHPERTCVRISHGGQEYRSKDYSAGSTALIETIRQNDRPCGFVEVACLDRGCGTPEAVFLEDERRLLKAIAGLLGNILEKKAAEMSLKRTTGELRRQTRELEDKNTALREIISQFELEKKVLQEQLRTNIELTVFPLLGRMQDSNLPPDALKNCLSVVRQNLEDVTSSVSRTIIDDRTRLSPREFEICNLVRNGRSNKDIAELLQISLLTVERHRHNIRRKLRIDNEHVNLSTFLRSR